MAVSQAERVTTHIGHRGANQARHTFASQALSSYVPIEWVARQLGNLRTSLQLCENPRNT
ncbi:hypothetical protein CXB65_20370 [Pseudomonas monteilii]|uniref:Integrase n=1 Tax=Pseudomonas monteilii TaxID=76759 RepID=A0A2N1IP15_9PSED|nr:hypothetical protein CXB65_20370 [Pseudomonas monteilii]RPD92970.1 hypothetical protein EGN69_21240 [Pseudomonas monteilii]